MGLGMKTVIRIYQNKDGSFGGEKLIGHLGFEEMLRLVGFMEMFKSKVCEDFELEELDVKEIDDIRDLMGDDEGKGEK